MQCFYRKYEWTLHQTVNDQSMLIRIDVGNPGMAALEVQSRWCDYAVQQMQGSASRSYPLKLMDWVGADNEPLSPNRDGAARIQQIRLQDFSSMSQRPMLRAAALASGSPTTPARRHLRGRYDGSGCRSGQPVRQKVAVFLYELLRSTVRQARIGNIARCNAFMPRRNTYRKEFNSPWILESTPIARATRRLSSDFGTSQELE